MLQSVYRVRPDKSEECCCGSGDGGSVFGAEQGKSVFARELADVFKALSLHPHAAHTIPASCSIRMAGGRTAVMRHMEGTLGCSRFAKARVYVRNAGVLSGVSRSVAGRGHGSA